MPTSSPLTDTLYRDYNREESASDPYTACGRFLTLGRSAGSAAAARLRGSERAHPIDTVRDSRLAGTTSRGSIGSVILTATMVTVDKRSVDSPAPLVVAADARAGGVDRGLFSQAIPTPFDFGRRSTASRRALALDSARTHVCRATGLCISPRRRRAAHAAFELVPRWMVRRDEVTGLARPRQRGSSSRSHARHPRALRGCPLRQPGWAGIHILLLRALRV